MVKGMSRLAKLWYFITHFKLNIMNYDVFLQISALSLAFIHLVLMIAMRLGGQIFLAGVNIISICVYLIAFHHAGKKRIRLVYYIFIIEILIYSSLSVYILGEDTQFGLYCLAVMPFTFLTGYILDCQNLGEKVFHPFANVTVLALFYFIELSMGDFFEPRYTIDSVIIMNFLRILNMLINIFCILFGCGVLSMVAVDHTRTIHSNMEEMERLMHQAEASNEAKSAFLANMSHEIRTPMNAICGMADMLLDEKLTEQGREYADTIKSSSAGLLSIINDILDFSKIESGKMPIIPEEYYFASLVHDVASMMEVRVKDRPVELITNVPDDVPSKLYGDTGRVKQILINIVGNAVKFTHEGTVTIGISWQAQDNDMGRLIFSVADTGVGIKEEDMAKLFDSFEQVDMKKNRGVEGTGLGLSISKLLVESMGGHISVESEYGVGSTFTFDIIQKIIDATPCEYNKNKRGVGHKQFAIDFCAPDAKVLVVDDNKVNLRVAAGLLKKFGIVPDTVDNGQDSIDIIRGQSQYDLVFMDHMMPEMDGIEAVQKIRSIGTQYTDQLPIVALSANAVKGMEEQFLAGGMNDFLPKPIELAMLGAILKKWLPPDVMQEVR
ncbi:MAG: response regulator [Lachnospiraceae bacterium]|nr:response regulator [Lachnospiraceae bacterium]